MNPVVERAAVIVLNLLHSLNTLQDVLNLSSQQTCQHRLAIGLGGKSCSPTYLEDSMCGEAVILSIYIAPFSKSCNLPQEQADK